MTISSADADRRMMHRKCAKDSSFRSFEQALFVANVHSGHGPGCKQYSSASAYSLGSAENQPWADWERTNKMVLRHGWSTLTERGR
ncbi:hypothetical protein [Nocardia gamkensis]|uniref:Uncharacterized protein n=1 Tax=Nocardia gamkensis TaxID=352869 RepID=A0A7X6R432_9NOCA|nr:hypothetical protein [Nocardia gamkensis]NKY27983.1 hypothetical protein [Nocardia gamkensis]NQE68649.1 hypothetical protein [Nocardia gamkensis]